MFLLCFNNSSVCPEVLAQTLLLLWGEMTMSWLNNWDVDFIVSISTCSCNHVQNCDSCRLSLFQTSLLELSCLWGLYNCLPFCAVSNRPYTSSSSILSSRSAQQPADLTGSCSLIACVTGCLQCVAMSQGFHRSQLGTFVDERCQYFTIKASELH